MPTGCCYDSGRVVSPLKLSITYLGKRTKRERGKCNFASFLCDIAALGWSSREEISHIQGKRKPSKMVGTERGHQSTDIQKPQSQTTSQSDHMGHSLV